MLDLLLARKETAEFVTAKLWREFVSPEPDVAEVKRIARVFRDANYEIKVALRELLLSPAFYAAENRGVLVKSPVDLVVGTLRSLEIRPDQTLPFAVAAAGMGQNLMSPPNVKGWPGGETWINTTTLLARKQFVDRVTRADESSMAVAAAIMNVVDTGSQPMEQGEGARAPRNAVAANPVVDEEKARQRRFARQMERGISNVQFNSARWMAQFPGSTPGERGRSAQRLLLAVEPQQPADFNVDSLALVHGLMLDAAYQLK